MRVRTPYTSAYAFGRPCAQRRVRLRSGSNCAADRTRTRTAYGHARAFQLEHTYTEIPPPPPSLCAVIVHSGPRPRTMFQSPCVWFGQKLFPAVSCLCVHAVSACCSYQTDIILAACRKVRWYSSLSYRSHSLALIPWLVVYAWTVITLGAHAQRGYCSWVCLSVCLLLSISLVECSFVSLTRRPT